jgi:hypothetical protein
MGWRILQIAALVSLLITVSTAFAEPVSPEVCAKELAKRYRAAAEIEEAASRVASTGGPRAVREAREDGRVREQFRRLREETCLDPRSPYPGPP